jgi:type IV pilus assembly protein PilZ
MDKLFDIALIVPYISQKASILEEFLVKTRKTYPPSILKGISLYSWSSSDTMGIIFSFDFSSFLPQYLKGIEAWAEKSEARLYNLMESGEREREVFKSKFPLTSDLKFIGDFDIPSALNSIITRTNATSGRKYPRYSTSIKVTFQSKEDFVQAYTKDISKGGIFVATDKPLPMESVIKLVLSLPNFSREIGVIGEVVHIFGSEQARLLDHNRVSGMGVQFIEFEEDGQKVLEEYFNSLEKSS